MRSKCFVIFDGFEDGCFFFRIQWSAVENVSGEGRAFQSMVSKFALQIVQQTGNLGKKRKACDLLRRSVEIRGFDKYQCARIHGHLEGMLQTVAEIMLDVPDNKGLDFGD